MISYSINLWISSKYWEHIGSKRVKKSLSKASLYILVFSFPKWLNPSPLYNLSFYKLSNSPSFKNYSNGNSV